MRTNTIPPGFDLNPPPVSRNPNPPPPPILPTSWACSAILHPFSPPLAGTQPNEPFFELCIAYIYYQEGVAFTAQLLGASGRTWWYWLDPSNVTRLSIDQGSNWSVVQTGWQLPSTTWIGSGRYFATGPLNWMKEAPSVDWWTQPASAETNPNAATWIWYDTDRQLPVRMMFGAPPPTYDTGTADQLALFQNFSFTYFPSFVPNTGAPPEVWTTPSIPAFTFGNPQALQLFVWNSNFGMSPMMTPVNQASNPLPTQVYYHWAADADYGELRDRAQATQMSYVFNSQEPAATNTDTVVMYGEAPATTPSPPPFAGQWIDYSFNNAGYFSCTVNPGAMALGAEAPDWVSTPGECGTIWATVDNDPVVSPGNIVGIYSVIFPPTTQYPQGRFLWTWYSPFPDGTDGVHARPVTFMESASSISEGGTSLALADYYDYKEFADPIPPDTFSIPLPLDLPILPPTESKQTAEPRLQLHPVMSE